MFDYRYFSSALHTRGIRFDEKQYLFVAMVAAGEDPTVSYGLIYDTQEFKRNVPSEEEETYLATLKNKANTMLEQQECVQLRDIIEEAIRAEVQKRSTDIKEYKFSSQEIINMLSAMLAEKSSILSESSVKDIVSLIRELSSLGGLSGSDSFQSHFIQVKDPYPALCVSCNREFDIYAGISAKCPHCQQVYTWSEEDNRFYPQPAKL